MLGLFIFLFLIITVFGIFGMQLFGGRYATNFEGGLPRSNFDRFAPAWLTIFQVTSSDQWMSITWSAMRLQWVSGHVFFLCVELLDLIVISLTSSKHVLCGPAFRKVALVNSVDDMALTWHAKCCQSVLQS